MTLILSQSNHGCTDDCDWDSGTVFVLCAAVNSSFESLSDWALQGCAWQTIVQYYRWSQLAWHEQGGMF